MRKFTLGVNHFQHLFNCEVFQTTHLINKWLTDERICAFLIALKRPRLNTKLTNQKYINMKNIIILFLLSMFILTSCTETKPIVREKQIRTTEATVAVITEPMILEIERLSPQPITDSTVFNINGYSTAEQLNAALPEYKQYALEEFIFKSEYDMIVNVAFHVYTRANGKTTNWADDEVSGQELVVVVSGYGVKYKQLRKATPADEWMSNFGGHK